MKETRTESTTGEPLPEQIVGSAEVKDTQHIELLRRAESPQTSGISLHPEPDQIPMEASGYDRDDVESDPEKHGRPALDSAPTIAPWSKTSNEQGTGNGLSLREIQRQEELRRKAEERTTVALQDRDEVSKAAAARWNVSGQPWGGAADSSKQQTLSFKEKMRLEEEQKKKKTSQVTRDVGLSVQNQATSSAPRPLTTKTGWASLVAKNSRPLQPVRKPIPQPAPRRTEDEAPFWETVGAPSQSAVPSSARSVKPSFVGRVPQPVHTAPGRTVTAKTQMAPQAKARNVQSNVKASKIEERDSSPEGENTVIGRRVSNEFARWCSESLKELTGNKIQDTVMFDYLVAIKSPSEIRDTILQNLGANDKTRSFADEFIRRLEFERNSIVADAGSGSAGGRKKGRRHRSAKVDPSLVLGFTSTSSRIMQGTIETPEMK